MHAAALGLAGLLAWIAVLPAQIAGVVAEGGTATGAGVASLQTRLDANRRYLLQVDGPAGTPFTAHYLSIHVSRTPSRGGTGNDDGSFQATAPYQQELVATWAEPMFWRYSIVVSPQNEADVAVRIVDAGPR